MRSGRGILNKRGVLLLVGVTLLALGQPVSGTARPASGKSTKTSRSDVVRIKVLSNRADLISGGDALVEIVLPKGATPRGLQVSIGRRDVSPAFAPRPQINGRILGLVKGLKMGRNGLTARLPDGRGARITLTNYPIGGPIFAGPQVQPWICTTQDHGLGPAQDEQCNAPTIYEFFYMPEGGGEFQPYDPDNPPDDVSRTKTDEGVTVPYIVRQETGVIDRGIYNVAVLHDPGKPWKPWAPQQAWNGKLFWRFGGACYANHVQPTNTGSAASLGSTTTLDDHALARGFAVASSGLNILGKNCNDVVSAEAVMMLKEHIVERYGEVRYTMSTGGSGGSIQQHLIASNYPGLLDGVIPTASFPDMWQIVLEEEDCVLLERAFGPAGIVDPAEMAAAAGHQTTDVCQEWTAIWHRAWQDPAYDFGCQGGISRTPQSLQPVSWNYDPMTNPTGPRCTIQDYQVAQFGRRPPRSWGPVEKEIGRGFANSPFDNVGVEYGREALEAGAITPQQFVALNENVGGYDIDYVPQLERKVADPGALVAAYRGGRVTYPGAADSVPIIHPRGTCRLDPTPVEDGHTCFHSYAMRARLKQANGHADNMIILYESPANFDFDLMDKWLAAIEADQSDDPLSVKVVRNKPAEAVDSCWIDGQQSTDWARCQKLHPYWGNPRRGAGGPLAGNVLKCQLKPLDRADYKVEFTDAQWTRLEAAFPDGVCDYSKPGVAQQPTTPWRTYLAEDGSAIPGGALLGPPPSSVPFDPGAGERARPSARMS